MVLGCVAGVIGGAATLGVKSYGLPTNWLLTGVAAVLLIAATWLRIASDRERGAKEAGPGGGSAGAAGEAIAAIAADVRALRARADSLELAALAAEIDQLVARRIYPVIDAQQSLIASQGFARYAAHTSPWAAGERMVYRAWSAATDGHRPEALASLDEALPHLDEAARSWAAR